MDFEDIVDMDWLNSHTVESSTSLPSPPIIKEEPMDMHIFPHTTTNIDMLVMPSTEQIKQLIELAKKQLALREQMVSSIPEPTPEPESPISINPSTITTSDTTPATTENNQSKKRGSIPSEIEGAISLEAYAANDGIDIKSLNSKERRQLRNKISARNFRVRRKGKSPLLIQRLYYLSIFIIEYITSLEGQVSQHKKENEQLLEKLQSIEEENKKLKVELESLKCQNIQLSKNTQDTSILVS